MNHYKKILVLSAFLAPQLLKAQEAAKTPFIENHMQDIVMILVIAAMLVVLLGMYFVLKAMLYLIANDTLKDPKPESYSILPSFNLGWKKLSDSLTDATPIEHEEDILLDHDYDGIKELDNHLPPWWKYMFYATIVFAFGYYGYYHVWGLGSNQYERYDKKIAELNQVKADFLATSANNVDETTVVMLTDPGRIENGKKLFKAKTCNSCHGDLGEGNQIGPNLTDEYWLHGGSIKDVFSTIKYGVPSKGMISWQSQILPSDMNDIASYILSLQGSNPPNAKDPQGELYVPEVVEEMSTDSIQ